MFDFSSLKKGWKSSKLLKIEIELVLDTIFNDTQ